MKFRESTVSAHHNYLVNQVLTPGFVVGNPDSREDFYFLAHVLRPGESEPKISGRIFDAQGGLVLEWEQGRILANPLGCVRQSFAGGYRMALPSGESLLRVQTESFANGYLTRIQGKFYDREGKLRTEPYYDSLQVHGEFRFCLTEPLVNP